MFLMVILCRKSLLLFRFRGRGYSSELNFRAKTVVAADENKTI